MPWNRPDPDPLEERRRTLEEQERLLAERRRRLTEQLEDSGQSLPDAAPSPPPVWRMEEESQHQRTSDPIPLRKRNLAHQRRRDMILFFICIALFLVVIIVLWVAYARDSAAPRAAWSLGRSTEVSLDSPGKDAKLTANRSIASL